MPTTESIPDRQNGAFEDAVPAGFTVQIDASGASPEPVDAVAALLDAASALARTRITTLPELGLGSRVREVAFCNDCKRQQTLKGLEHAESCAVGHVMAACARVRAELADHMQVRMNCEHLADAEYVYVPGERQAVAEFPLTPERGEQVAREFQMAARRPQAILESRGFSAPTRRSMASGAAELPGCRAVVEESEESWQASAALLRERRVVCGRAIAVFGWPGRDVLTCDLEPGHGDAWHEDKAAGRKWEPEATELHFHPETGMLETRLLGAEPRFEQLLGSTARPDSHLGATEVAE